MQSDHSCRNENYVTKVELDLLVILKSSTYVSFESSATSMYFQYTYMYRVKSGTFGHQVNSDIHLQTVEIQMRRLLMSR